MWSKRDSEQSNAAVTPSERIAIVGMGGLFPPGVDPAGLWELVCAGRDGAREVPPGRWLLDVADAFDPTVGKADHVYSKNGCFLDAIPCDHSIPADLDPLFHLTLHVGRHAWASAVTTPLDLQRVAVILGNLVLPTETASQIARATLGRRIAELLDPQCAARPDWHFEPLNRYPAGLPAALLAKTLGLGGGSFTLDAACASSLYAIKLGCEELLAGRADAVLAGGVSRPDCLYTQMGFSQLRALSPTGRCSPFDARADGLVVGEGAGIFVLKRLSDALQHGDTILGVIAGVGVSNDVGGSLLAPSSTGQLRAMREAYRRAGWSPSDVDLIECHATGTQVGDRVEFGSLRTLWGESGWRPGQCVLGCVKGTVGHLLTAAGGAGLAKVLFALRHRQLPGTANYSRPAPGLDLDQSPFRFLQRAEPWETNGRPRRAALSAFGFGGINAHLLIEEWSASRGTAVVREPRDEAIAVVGMDAAFGPWDSLDAFRQRVLGFSKAEPRPPSRWWGIEPTCLGYFIDEVAVEVGRFRIPPQELREMLPQQLLMLRVAANAIERAQLPADDTRLRTGVYIGLGLDLNTTQFHLRWSMLHEARRLGADQEWLAELRDAVGPPLTANATMGALGSIAASRIAREFHFGGPSFTVSSEETSGLRALEVGVRALRAGDVDCAVVGAVDLAGEVRAVLAAHTQRPVLGEGAATVVLKRLADAQRDGDRIHAVIRGAGAATVLGSAECDVGHAGAASGLASFVKACLCLEAQVLPEGPQHWLRDRCLGPRRCLVAESEIVLEEGHAEDPPVGALPEALFVVEGADRDALSAGLTLLGEPATSVAGLRLPHPATDVAGSPGVVALLAHDWLRAHPLTNEGLAVALVARDVSELRLLADAARRSLTTGEPLPPGQRDRIAYASEPLVGEVAFVFPGSGNDYPAMGRALALHWPAVLRQQDSENETLRSQFQPDQSPDTRGRIFQQVTLGCLVADLLATFGVRPQAVLGYSLGESAALFALRAWRDRDEMLRRMNASTLFTDDLTGERRAARTAWRLAPDQPVEWSAGIVDRPAEIVERVCAELPRVYQLIRNSPHECMIGGERAGVDELVRRLGCAFAPLTDASTVHCELLQPVADAYRALHLLPTSPPSGVRFYSTACQSHYELTQESAAEAILAQASGPVDFAATVEAAYRDGVRIFIEIGPGTSCSRMIAATLGDRPHRVRSACFPRSDEVSTLLRLLALLIAERVPVELTPLFGPVEGEKPAPRLTSIPVGGAPFRLPPVPTPCRADVVVVPSELTQAVAVEEARIAAHSAYLRFSAAIQDSLASQMTFLSRLTNSSPVDVPLSLDRSQCLEFAVGSIARVLGERFAEVDGFPTRVRLPDEPLMLVDRILLVEGEPLSLTSGRVVTEHDVLRDGWYLDAGRIPTSIAVEAGQADLFLAGYLGIDLHTRGLAVYRLLDAVVTFHRGLPAAGAVIRYDIHIDSFFRQGDTLLFRFRFEGTVDGEPLLSMRDGCAGFFTPAALEAGKGVVRTELEKRPRPGVQPADWRDLVPMSRESFSAPQIEVLRQGRLAECFGPSFAEVPQVRTLPGGHLQLIDRVPLLDPQGGRFGLGLVRAEADIDPQAWFLTCHFVDDQVMPGTLMYECCLHTLRVLLLRMGWVGDEASEPVPGVSSRLKCRGQVTAATRVVSYDVEIKERGYRPEPYVIADALMYADGKAIVEIVDMSLRLVGLTRPGLEQLWAHGRDERKPAIYGPERILAFAVGKPSEAFGEPYRVFDSERVIARLPGPPYQFLDRITELSAAPWQLVAGGEIEAQYDVPPDAWYFDADRQALMPFAVLLEVALQPCGWLAAYLGSALTSPVDLSFRNLGGNAEQLADVGRDVGTLTTQVKITRASTSAGMIIQAFDFTVRNRGRVVYRGDTTFGFFSKEALAQQVGIRDAVPWAAEASHAFLYPETPPFPDDRWRMIDRIECLLPEGGPLGCGFVSGSKTVDPSAWFFQAHFYQDPVCPGSLGLESLIQLMKVAARARWNVAPTTEFVAQRGGPHSWLYRGQVIPTNRLVTVQALVTEVNDETQTLRADGYLLVDERCIYRMKDFTLSLRTQGTAP